MLSDHVFTSGPVSEGRPDKRADRISETVVQAFLTADPTLRVGSESLCTTNRIVIAGEARGPVSATRVLCDIARNAIKEVGYEQDGFDCLGELICQGMQASSSLAPRMRSFGAAAQTTYKS